MTALQILIFINAGAAIILQAFLPQLRHIIIVAGAIIAIVLSTISGLAVQNFFSMLPLDVLAILIALQLFGEILVESKIFDVLTRLLAKISGGRGWLIIITFSVITYCVNCFTDNYQCLILMVPPIIGMLKQVDVSKRYLQIVFGLLLVTSNLGGASTPIGDFPALYMLSHGLIGFGAYLSNATPLLLISFLLCVGTAVAFYRFKPLPSTGADEATAKELTIMLYRNVSIDWKILGPTIVSFAGMTLFWILGFDTVKVAIIGFLALALWVKKGKLAELKISRTGAAIFIYYLCLFAIIVSIEQTGFLQWLAHYLLGFKQDKILMLIAFVTVTTLVTGVVSAGPSTIAMFPVVQAIAGMYPPHLVITCFILSICAGSSLFLTSATAGPLMSRLTDEHEIMVGSKKAVYTFKDYLLPGLVGCTIIYLVNITQLIFKLL